MVSRVLANKFSVFLVMFSLSFGRISCFYISPKNNREDCVDLHGLKVREALSILQERLDIAKALNCKHLLHGGGWKNMIGWVQGPLTSRVLLFGFIFCFLFFKSVSLISFRGNYFF